MLAPLQLGKLLEDLSRAAERNRETYQHVVDHLPRFTNEELHGPTLSSHFFDGVENTIQHTDDIRGRLSTASSDLTGELQHALHEAKGVIDRLHGEIHSRDEVIASMRHSAAMSQRVVDELDARTSEAEKSTLEVRSRGHARSQGRALTPVFPSCSASASQDRGRPALPA